MFIHSAQRLLFILAVLFLPLPLWAGEVELFVLAGQSNMLGYGGNAIHYPRQHGELDDKIAFYWVAPGISSSNGRWTRMRAQGGIFPHGHFGIEVTFARGLVERGIHPYIFKYSLGSTSLANNWRGPGENGMYDQMLVELRKAIVALQSTGNQVTIKALIWIQGESDAETKEMADKYQLRLIKLIRDFRLSVASNPKLPVVLGVDEQHPWVRNQPVVVESQKRIAASDGCELFTSMIGLPKIDTSHLTPQGLQLHGKRILEAYLDLRKKCN